MCSLSASPLPTPRLKRPSSSTAVVAALTTTSPRPFCEEGRSAKVGRDRDDLPQRNAAARGVEHLGGGHRGGGIDRHGRLASYGRGERRIEGVPGPAL